MILVTGATGTVGREVVRRLPVGAGVRVLVRRSSRIADTDRTTQTAVGDYRDGKALSRALAGVRTAFLVTVDVTAEIDECFLQTARAAGVERVVKLSAAAVLDPEADDAITRGQRAAEELLRGSGMSWTLLRPRSFMSNALSWAGSIRDERVVRTLYGDSANACVDPRDVAEVAVRALTEEGHAGKTYTLTGPRAVTAAEQARILGRLLGVPLRLEELSPDQARAGFGKRYPAAMVEALLQSAERQRAGAKAGVADTVGRVTGAPARDFGVWARDHLEVFTPGGAASDG